jgi:hypothetical protein
MKPSKEAEFINGVKEYANQPGECSSEVTVYTSHTGVAEYSTRVGEYSRRMKNVLLLTAAFGAVHQAVQAENMLECLPM